MAYEEFKKKIVDLQGDWGLFKIDFINRDSFKDFADHLCNDLLNENYNEVCITGYFRDYQRATRTIFKEARSQGSIDLPRT